MVRKIVHIDESKCNGCGACASACHENAIVMVNNKARLLRDDFCDGLGDCLPACPAGAITIEERESIPYSEEEVEKRKKSMEQNRFQQIHQGGSMCPGNKLMSFAPKTPSAPKESGEPSEMESQLTQWPVQIKLLPVEAPFYDKANLLVAADCTAYAYAAFHRDFIRNHITLVGCPKLDMVDYTEKLTEIISRNDIKSITVVRMEVPCCGGLERAATEALKASGKFIPWRVVTISRDGKILD